MNSEELKKTVFKGLSDSQVKQVEAIAEKVKLAVALVERLRGPKGCPWDREQDHLTLRPYLIEEAYEVLEILDRYEQKANPKEMAKKTPPENIVPASGSFSEENAQKLKEELGDLFLQVLLHSTLSQERNDFDLGDVSFSMTQKLVSRHPHVFGAEQVSGSEQVLQNWESLKKKEGKKRLLDGLPKSLPSLQRAARIGEKAKSVGFDWTDWKGSWIKVEEEINELKHAIDSGQAADIEEELGDTFFALCNLSRHLKIQPEDAHRKAIEKFELRFRKLEDLCEKQNIEMSKTSLEELDKLWEQVKTTCKK